MAIIKSEKIWFDGKLVGWDDAKIHVLSHVVHYGTSFFEGARCYHTRKGSAVFRIEEHVQRLLESCKIYRTPVPYTKDEIIDAIQITIRANRLTECYIRPIILRGFDSLGLDPRPCPVHFYIAVWNWGAYLGQEALKDGVAVCVSSWRRSAPNTHPTLAKAGGNYLNSQLIKMEALANGYSEGIGLDYAGWVSEGSGENLFLVRKGTITTVPLSGSILPGITRDSVIKLAGDLDIPVREEPIPREALYIADELFFTGTAAEITPIVSVDRLSIGNGTRGTVTERLQNEFFGIVSGRKEDRHGWLTYL